MGKLESCAKILNHAKCFHLLKNIGFGDSTDLGDSRVKWKLNFSNFFWEMENLRNGTKFFWNVMSGPIFTSYLNQLQLLISQIIEVWTISWWLTVTWVKSKFHSIGLHCSSIFYYEIVTETFSLRP